ncbi:MAG: 30S ribosomal protein S4 [Candidatus Methanofastidiosa archaeon]|nr:30S ribosomal protein S4 [Candidatus Methanofastidiosa archaeon]
MGDPKKIRRKYDKPSHPWQKDRIDSENVLMKKYGLANKKEIWKALSFLRNVRRQARALLAMHDEAARKQSSDLISMLQKYGILKEESTLEEVLTLSLEDILDRRLQSLVFRKGLAKTPKQARQFIVHKHIILNGAKVSIPSYLVPKSIEDSIGYSARSSLNDPSHPEVPRKTVTEEGN